ncbi:MAG: RodZ domain-containing protein [Elusimicrobiota bacterium]
MKLIGEILKKRREERKLTLEEIHNDTYISKGYIKALEEGNMDVFPAEVYYLGFLKRYASYLRLNPDELVSRYYNSIKQRVETSEDFKINKKIINYRPVLFIILFAIFSVTAYLLYKSSSYFIRNNGNGELARQQSAAATENPDNVNSAPLTLEIEIVENSWIKVVTDDKVVFEGILSSGKKQKWTAGNNIRLNIGYTTGVKVRLNGEPVDITKGARQEVNELNFNAKDLSPKKVKQP